MAGGNIDRLRGSAAQTVFNGRKMIECPESGLLEPWAAQHKLAEPLQQRLDTSFAAADEPTIPGRRPEPVEDVPGKTQWRCDAP